MNNPSTGELSPERHVDPNGLPDNDSSSAWRPRRVAIIGVGLLGGSFGLALREAFPAVSIVGVSRSAASRQAAIGRGAVDQATDSVEQACEDADLVVVATPVDRVAELVVETSGMCTDDAIVTDLGSTKATIVAAVESHDLARQKFVGAHPIAGGEKTGAQHSKDDLFRERTVVLTPTEQTDAARLRRCQDLWERLGARVVVMSPRDHDQAVATVSHIPHLMASLLADFPQDAQRRLAGTGWLDTTRVASGDPEMWAAICQENRLAIVAELDRFSDSVAGLKHAILCGDNATLMTLLQRAKQTRDAIAQQSRV